MPLAVSATLAQGILAFSDPNANAFPATPAEVAQKWAAAAKSYFSTMLAPPMQPGIFSLAEAAMIATMTPLVQPAVPGTGLAALQVGFLAFAAALPPGALPAVAVPPPSPPALPAMPPSGDPTGPANAVAAAIATWAITGTFTVPPAPAVLPWA